MSKEEDKNYYRINDGESKENDDNEMTTGSKRSKKKIIIIVSLIVVVSVALAILLLILFLVDNGSIPSGYNGFVQKSFDNQYYGYFARLRREKDVNAPVDFGPNNPEFLDVDFSVCMLNDRSYRITYEPTQESIGSSQKRHRVENTFAPNVQCDKTKRLAFGDFNVDESPFGFTLKNPSHKDTFWLSTKDRNLILSDKYLEVGFEIHSQEIFGWGQRTRDFKLEEGEYTSWTSGISKEIDPAEKGHNTYGDHPFILARLNDRSYLGLFFLNSNAKVMKYIKQSKGKSVINFKTIGGILDVFAFMGETADEVLQEYHKVIGKPHFPPFWALGFQQGSTSYSNDTIATNAVDKFNEYDIPLEALWLDEQFMSEYRPFNVDKVRFSKVNTLAKKLKSDNQFLGISLHPGIPLLDADGTSPYPYFTEAKQAGVLIKSATNSSTNVDGILIGEHLPGQCSYLDFSSPLTYGFWTRAITNLHNEVNYNAIQLNYNEVTQLCDGECPKNASATLSGRFSNLPFNPIGDNNQFDLQSKAISLDGMTWAETENHTDAAVMFNVHSLYGSRQLEMTAYYLEHDGNSPNSNQRVLAMSRSTFAGAGAYGGHWLGDNEMSWESMRHSISEIMNFQLFGVPFTGANICGTTGDVDQEMCARWYQLGAFYPFARSNFNGTFGTKEPWALKDKYQSSARTSLKIRLSLLRYFYTTMFENSKDGGSFWKPLFFLFPQDDKTMDHIDSTFMIGNSLKLTPVTRKLEAGEKIKSYFPANTRFLDLVNWSTIIDGGSKGSTVDLEPSLETPLMHLREGRIIPYQNLNIANRTNDLVSKHPLQILVFPDTQKNAEGTVYVDTDGLDEAQYENGNYQYYKMTFHDRQMRFVLMDGQDSGGQLDMNQILNNVTIVDAQQYNDTNFACMFSGNMEPSKLNFTYDSATKRLHIFATDDTQVIDLRSLRNIQFGNNATDQNFCDVQYQVSKIETVQTGELANKQVIVSVEATGFKMIGFNAIFTLLKDNLVNVDLVPELEPAAFKPPSITLNSTFFPVGTSLATSTIDQFVTISEVNEYFWFEIHVKGDASQILFSTKEQPLVYTEFYKSMGAKVYTNSKLFGLGERIGDFWKGIGTYTVWNRAGDHQFDNGNPPGDNLYGSHPVYFTQRSTGSEFFGVLEFNSGPQDFVIEQDSVGMRMTNIKTTGRTNLFFMMNESVDKVIKNYYNLVGNPHLPPEWGFGWHQSRFGYNGTDVLREIYNGYREKNLPLDGLWNDVDLLEAFRVFELDTVNFGDIKDVIADIAKTGTHYIPIVGSGIASGNGDAYFDGKKKGVFIKSPADKSEPLIGRNTPGDVVFVDFYMHNSKEFYLNRLEKFHEEVPFDGVWLDVNEITSFCDGVCYIDQMSPNPIDNRLFYWPGGRSLEKGTINLDAIHEGNILEIDTHNLYGLLHSYVTSEYFTENEKRPFIVSRSTFTGSGKYAGHWTGDNDSSFVAMRNSVTSILLFNMFAVPFVGADVCGYKGDSLPVICTQWYKLAVVYPFARNHNELTSLPQEPFVDRFNITMDSSRNITAQDIIRKAMFMRYGLHIYSYTQHHKASTEGIPPLKPLFFVYPSDTYSYDYIEENFMFGDHVKVSAHTAIDRSNFYFPESNGLWCPIWPGIYTECFIGGSFQSINVPASEILLHIRAGSMIPLQLSNSSEFNNITTIRSLQDLSNQRTDLGLLLDSNNKAKGDVRFDGGETTDLSLYTEIVFETIAKDPFFGYPSMQITFNVTRNSSPGVMTNSQKLGDILIYNANKLSFVGRSTAEITTRDFKTHKATAVWNEEINLTRLSHDGAEDLYLTDILAIQIEANQ